MYSKSFTHNGHLFTSLLLFLLMLVTATACNLPGSEPDEPVDPDAQPYRMYFDDEDGEFQVRRFTGQLRMADYEGIFGETDDLQEDDNGNLAAGPITRDGMIWNLVMSPSQVGVNLMSRDLDGTISSAIDLDGDGRADIVDIRLPDGRRLSFVTEGLGMGVFEQWLLGNNPLCNQDLGEIRGFAIWGCADDEDGGEEGSGGGGVASAPGSGYVDPLDLMCSEYNSRGNGINRQIRGWFNPAQGSRESIEYWLTESYSAFDGGPEGTLNTQTSIYENADGRHTETIRLLYYFDEDGELIQTTEERVDNDGNGVRRIRTFADGRRTSSRVQEFTTEVDDGDYNSYRTDPASPIPDPSSSDSSEDPAEDPGEEPPPPPPPPPPETGSGDPGPDGDDSSLADFCERRGNVVSGVEQAAATDPTAFSVACGDLVGAPASGDDCIIIDGARAGDFRGALEPGDDDGCDDFYERGQGGDCEPTTALEMLRGRTALIASLNLPGIVLCSPLVCGGLNLVEGEAQQAYSSTDIAPTETTSVEFSTLTPTPEPSSVGAIPEITLCYWGPGAEWGTVSSLKKGLEVKIVGVGAEEGWLIMDNPNFEAVSCWVDEDDVEVPPGLDLGSLPEFETPALPDDGGGDDGQGDGGNGQGATTAPAAPSGLGQNTVQGQICKVTLSWNDNSSNEDGFRIYRDGILIGTVGANATQFTDNNATETLGYSYSVRAYNSAGESSSSNSVNSQACFG